MTILTPATNRGFDGNSLLRATRIPGFTAGSIIPRMTPVRLDATDGKIYPAASGCSVNQVYTSGSMTSNKAVTDYLGFTFADCSLNQEGITVVRNCDGEFSSAMSPNAKLFISATPGVLAAGSSVGNLDNAVGIVISSTHVYIY